LVPQDHITELLAPEGGDTSSHTYPTRQNILSKLWSLHQDERIRHGDTIIVFYAGHGALYSSGAAEIKETNSDQKSSHPRKPFNVDELKTSVKGSFIDAIVPADRGLPDPDPTYHGKKVPDICDRELNTIFTITGQKKGPNILFIADCFYAASGPLLETLAAAASVSRSGPDALMLKVGVCGHWGASGMNWWTVFRVPKGILIRCVYFQLSATDRSK